MTHTPQTEAMRLIELSKRAMDNRFLNGCCAPVILLERMNDELRRLDALVAGLESVYKEAMGSLKLAVAERDQLLELTKGQRMLMEGMQVEMGKLKDQVERLQGGEPIGYINAGHLHEMECGRLSYTYLYPKHVVGASVPVYTAQPAAPAQTDERGRPMTYWGRLAEKPAVPALASHIEVLKARLNESNGILEAFKFQCQTAAFQLKENQAAIDSAPTVPAIPDHLLFSARHAIARKAGVQVTPETNAIIAATLEHLRAHGIGQPAGGEG